MNFDRVIRNYKKSHIGENEKCTPDSTFEEVLDKYRERVKSRGFSEKMRKINKSKINSNKLINDFKIQVNGEEFYILNGGNSLKIKLSLSEKTDSIPRINFRESLPLKNRQSFYIIPNRKSATEFTFHVESLKLNTDRYKIDIKLSEKKIVSDLRFEVKKSGIKPIKGMIFVDKINKYSSFPNGDFLKINPNETQVKEEGLIVVHYRNILRKVSEAYLYREGKFEKKVEGNELWCLIPENYERKNAS